MNSTNKQKIYSVQIKGSIFELEDLHTNDKFGVPFKTNLSKLLELDLYFRRRNYWDINFIPNTETQFHMTCKSTTD
jgi:hypothetical protein